MVNDGVLNFTDDSIHWIRYIVKDFVGNSTEIILKVKSTSKQIPRNTTESKPELFDCFKENECNTEGLKVSIPPNALYDDVMFKYLKPASVSGTFSPLYQIMNDDIALQKAYSLSIKAVRLPDSLQSKACIISLNEKGKRSYEGGGFSDGWVTTRTKSFGNFAIGIDTVPPKIKPAFKAIKDKTSDLTKAKTIGIIASDNLSGIRKYRATIDGKWVLCEYEFKQNLLFYTFDDTIAPGEHIFNIEVIDDKENKSSLKFTFKR